METMLCDRLGRSEVSINNTFIRNFHGQFFCSFWCIHGNFPEAISLLLAGNMLNLDSFGCTVLTGSWLRDEGGGEWNEKEGRTGIKVVLALSTSPLFLLWSHSPACLHLNDVARIWMRLPKDPDGWWKCSFYLTVDTFDRRNSLLRKLYNLKD